jgi:ketosteroid isomerase-like protein
MLRDRLLQLAAAMVLVVVIPAAKADDAALKKQLEQLSADYMACYNKHDPACIAALYTPDGFLVNPMGSYKPVEYYGNAFKMGFTHLELTLAQAYPVGADTVVATGTFHVTGKDKDGKALDANGNWGGTYVKEGDKLKVRMVTAAPKPPPAK